MPETVSLRRSRAGVTAALPSWLLDLGAVMLLALVTLAVFGRALRLGFLSDDFDWLVQATSPQYPLLGPIVTAGTGNYFRPLITLSLRLGQALGGSNAAIVQHALNLAIHAGTAAMLFAIVRVIGRSRLLGLGLALVFLCHPIAVPNAYWIASRVDSLMTFFYLLAVFAFINYVKRGHWLNLPLLVVAFAAALLTKEMAVTLVGTLVIVWLLLLQQDKEPLRSGRQVLWLLLALAAATVVYILALWLALYRGSADLSVFALSPRQIFEGLFVPVVLLFLPHNRSILLRANAQYPWLLWAGSALALIVVTAISLRLLVTRSWRQYASYPLAALLFLTTILPFVFSGANTRRMYLPIAALCIAIALLPLRSWQRKGVLNWGLFPLAAMLAVASIIYGSIWVENWELSQVFCRDFRRVMVGKDIDTPLFLLTVPSRSRDVAIFANDANPALFHCLTGEFGYFPRFFQASEFQTEDEHVAEDAFSLRQPGTGAFELTARAPENGFFVWANPSAGQRYADSHLTLIIHSVGDIGLVEEFSLVVNDPESLSGVTLLSFHGTRWLDISPAVQDDDG